METTKDLDNFFFCVKYRTENQSNTCKEKSLALSQAFLITEDFSWATDKTKEQAYRNSKSGISTDKKEKEKTSELKSENEIYALSEQEKNWLTLFRN